MLLSLAIMAGGLLLLTAGAEALVRGAISAANRLGMPPLLIGITIVGFGTSMPELLVSLKAALSGSPAIAIGNVVGSNTANILLIIGLAALISPMAARIANLPRDLAVMIGAAIVMLTLGWMGMVSRLAGVIMVATLTAYLVWSVRTMTRTDSEDEGDEDLRRKDPVWLMSLLVAGGLAGLFLGADLLVTSATDIARDFGISEAVIGLTIVAVGTSLPELATSVVAAFRRQAEVSLGNVIGSNIFNILGILGVTALIKPVPVDAGMAGFDIPLMLTVSLAFAALLLVAGKVTRTVGATMLAIYAGYVWWLV